MADIVLDHVSKRFPDGTVAVDDTNLEIGDGEFVILVGPSGCGKSTCLNMIAGLEDISDGELRIGGRGGGQPAGPQGPRHRHGVPELRPVPAHDGAGEHGLRAQAGPRRPRRDRPHRQPRGRAAGAHPAAEPQAGQPVGRPAPAGGHGPGHRPQPPGLPDGRAAVQPGRQAAGADAHHRLAAPEPAGHHHRLRHPRPDRGHDPGRPRGGHARRRHPAGRRPRGAVRAAAQPVRGRVHRLAGHELPAGHPRGRPPAHQPRRHRPPGRHPGQGPARRRRPRPDPGAAARAPRGRRPGRRQAGRGPHLPGGRRRAGVAGADKYAYFRLQGARATARELEELAADAGTGDAPGGADQVVARLDPASRAREGQQLELWVDTSKLHLFNPGNGAHLTL